MSHLNTQDFDVFRCPVYYSKLLTTFDHDLSTFTCQNRDFYELHFVLQQISPEVDYCAVSSSVKVQGEDLRCEPARC